MITVSPDILERFTRCYSLGAESNPLNVTGSPHFLRVKVPGGIITSDQFRRIAELATKYSRELVEITDRQDIQLHWIIAEDALDVFSVMDQLGFTTDMCGQGFGGAGLGDPRNIVCCPVSGIAKGEILNGYPLVKKLAKFFVGNPDFLDLPRKFKISISGCGTNCIMHEINDLAFIAVENGDQVGFMLLAGGSVGASLPGPRLAQSLGIFVKPEDAFDVAVAALETHRDYGNRESKAKARLKWLIEHWGLDKFRNMLEEKLGKRFERFEGQPVLKPSDHGGVGLQLQEGYSYVNIPTTAGRLTSHEMVNIADLAEKHGNGELRLTTTQNIIIPNVQASEALLEQLEGLGFPCNGSIPGRTSIGCPSEFCGKTKSSHAKELVNEIIAHLETNFNKAVLDEAEFRIHISGCPNNCCASTTAEIGLNAKRVKEGDEIKQTYDLYLGGGFGSDPSFGKLVEKNIPAEESKYKIASLLNGYVENKNPSENLRKFCNRHTNDELNAYLDKAGG